MTFDEIIDLESYPLSDPVFRASCRATLDRDGALVIPAFLRPDSVETVRREGEENRHLAFFCRQAHNVYLTPADPA